MYEWEGQFMDEVLNRGRTLFLNHKVAGLEEEKKRIAREKRRKKRNND